MTGWPAAWALGLALIVGTAPAARAQEAGVASAPVAGAPATGPSAVSAPKAKTGAQRVDAVEVELVAERTSVRPGGSVDLALRIRHDPHWHTYWRNPGDSGLPTLVEPTGPAGTRFEPIRWPTPERLWVGPLANYGYEGEIVLPFAARMPATIDGERVRIEAAAQWLVCKDVCIPGEARVAIDLPVGGTAEPARSTHAPLFDAMARRTPDPRRAIEARAHRDGQTLAIAFAAPAGIGSIARAEFFPHAEGVVAAPAPQTLRRTADGWRIDLRLADGAMPPDALDGVLRLDDLPVVVRAAFAAGAAPGGETVSVSAQPAGASRPGGTLLGALGMGAGARPDGTSSASGVSAVSASIAADAPGLALALAFGVLGGLLLNLMPCVFPVIGLKVLGFARAAGDAQDARRATRVGAAAFGAGVLVSFWLLAGAMLALRAAGESVGWGFQLQSPAFVAAMALLFVAVGLNFSGVFEIGLSMTRLGGAGGAGRDSVAGSFGAGVLAVLVATPCTAPFMGSALGYTLSQPPAWTMAVFTAIGVGMALPYVLLGLFPSWARRLPRPGRWMETLRQVLAFPMYATAAWLLWVLVQQAGADAMLRVLLASVALAAAAWSWGRWAHGAPRRPGLAGGIVLACAAGIAMLVWPLADPRADLASVASPSGSVGTAGALAGASASAAGSTARRVDDGAIDWAPWSEPRVAQALADGRTVFVDFTAAWCVSCQANKKLVLERDAVVAAMRASGVVAMRADWTQRDPAITAALARYGRNGVPLYLVLRPGASPVLLPELLTVATVVDALR